MKCIVNKLFIGALFLLGALVCSCQNTTENTVESSVAIISMCDMNNINILKS